MVAAITSGRLRFDAKRVTRRALQALRRNQVSFAILIFALVGAPRFFLSLLETYARSSNPDGASMETLDASFLVLAFALVAIFMAATAQAAVIDAAVNHRRNRVRALLADNLRHTKAMVGLSILLVLAIGLGLILFVVPGLVLGVLWVATAPAIVVEGRSVFASFSRSLRLTRGSRLAIFLLFLVCAPVLVVFLFGLLFVAVFLQVLIHGPNAIHGQSALDHAAIVTLGSMFVMLVGTLLAASIYSELRLIEGDGASAIPTGAPD
jgi:putative exporter of polyketide antibiotics